MPNFRSILSHVKRLYVYLFDMVDTASVKLESNDRLLIYHSQTEPLSLTLCSGTIILTT